jgi:molybdopterin-dependent oxidoreductase alpha subunit
MSETKNINPAPQAQPDIKHTGLKTKERQNVAAGIKAVGIAMGHLQRETGLVRGVSTLLKMNQFTGFDCPGCAWPDPDDKRSLLAEYCENGAKAVAEEATRKKVDPAFFARHSVAEMSRWSDYEIGKSGRITQPMILKPGASHYEPISWEEAFRMIADKLNALASPDEAIFYTSGRTSNEAAFLYQLFVRMYGTNNLPDCSNMCHESSGAGLGMTLGIGKGSVTLDDIHHAEVIMVVGQNPGTNHPRMLLALQECKRNGGKIITVNPLPETGLMRFKNPQEIEGLLGGGTELTDVFLQVKVNSDIALAKALMLMLLEAEEKAPGTVLDKAFIEEKTAGYEAFIEDLKKHNISDLVAACGVPEAEIRRAAELLIENKKIIICWAMGLTQHKNGVENIREMVNILLMKGAIGKPGAGTCPVRGHSNVQGDRTMGIWEAPKPAFLDKLEEVFDFQPPREHGYATVPAIQAMHQGKGKVFFAMGGNFLSATPDTEYTADALRKCEMSVQVSTKLNRSHLVTGETAIILPCLGRTEQDMQASGQQFVTVENSTGKVHTSQGELKPASKHLLSEPMIVARLAQATFGQEIKLDWERLAGDYDLIRDLIEQVIPGFENYNERVRQRNGFYLPNVAREGKFRHQDGKAHFSVNKVVDHQLKEGEFLMFTIRSHDQYNTTIYGLNDRYRGIHNERRVVLMSPKDLDEYHLSARQVVNLLSEYDGVQRKAEQFIIVPFDVPQGCVATYFPEANVLIPVDQFADLSQTPISKSVRIRIQRII